MTDDQIPTLNLHQLKVISALGRGAKGVVFLVRDESSGGKLFALKTFLRSSTTKKCKDNDNNDFELEVLRLSQHPLLPKLCGVMYTETIAGYAIDYCPGRDLNRLRKKQTEKMFSDTVIRFYAAELVIALEYLHGLGIVYRDLKPENVMIQENGHLMLVDFDLSTKLSLKPPCIKSCQPTQTTPLLKSDPPTKRPSLFSNCCRTTLLDSVHPESSYHISNGNLVTHSCTESFSKSNSFVGTEEYIAPEIIKSNGHDFTVDWWCLGIVLYEMLYGKTPFKGRDRKDTFNNIVSKSVELVGETTPLRDLIRKLLMKDPTQRLSVGEIKGHEFFKGLDWEKVVEISRPPFVPGPSDVEGMDVNKIDMEAFVQGVFEVDVEVQDMEEFKKF